MIIAILVLIALILLFGSAAVLGAIGVFLWILMISIALAWLGVPAYWLLCGFLAVVGLAFLATVVLPEDREIKWPRLPNTFWMNKKQRRFIADFDNYSAAVDQLSAAKLDFSLESSKGHAADPQRLSELQVRVRDAQHEVDRFY